MYRCHPSIHHHHRPPLSTTNDPCHTHTIVAIQPEFPIIPQLSTRSSKMPDVKPTQVSVDDPQTYEDVHVHAVYDEIAPHFSNTRYKVRWVQDERKSSYSFSCEAVADYRRLPFFPPCRVRGRGSRHGEREVSSLAFRAPGEHMDGRARSEHQPAQACETSWRRPPRSRLGRCVRQPMAARSICPSSCVPSHSTLSHDIVSGLCNIDSHYTSSSHLREAGIGSAGLSQSLTVPLIGLLTLYYSDYSRAFHRHMDAL